MLNLGEPLPPDAPEPTPLARVVGRHGQLWFRSDVWDCMWYRDDDNDRTAYTWTEALDAGPLRPVIEHACPRGCGPMLHHDFHEHEGKRRWCDFQEVCKNCGFQESGTLLCKGDCGD